MSKELLINLEKNINSNSGSKRIESANTNFTVNTPYNIKNRRIFSNQSNWTENYSMAGPKKESYYKPNWKYSYYLDKNDILSLNKNNSVMKNKLCDYQDIDKRPKPIVYSWTKPRMIKILENNAFIEEEVKTHFWKYSYLFENNSLKPPGKLLKLIIRQISQGYGTPSFYTNKNSIMDDNKSFNCQKMYSHWKVPGIAKIKRDNYETTFVKRPKSAYKF